MSYVAFEPPVGMVVPVMAEVLMTGDATEEVYSVHNDVDELNEFTFKVASGPTTTSLAAVFTLGYFTAAPTDASP